MSGGLLYIFYYLLIFSFFVFIILSSISLAIYTLLIIGSYSIYKIRHTSEILLKKWKYYTHVLNVEYMVFFTDAWLYAV